MIFCTVGTGRFDLLVRCVLNLGIEKLVVQAGSSDILAFKYCLDTDFNSYCDRADIIITHAGAGTVFGNLEKNKRLIVVPNLIRHDKHQSELCRYLEKNNFALVCWNFDDLPDLLKKASLVRLTPYEKEIFNGVPEILAILGAS